MYILPILEYGSIIWNPYFSKDVEVFEKLQRKVTKLPLSLRTSTYERLQALNLAPLAMRRKRADAIESFEVLQGFYNLPNLSTIFERSLTRSLRGHELKLRKSRHNKLNKKYFLTNRIVDHWNQLPQDVVTASNIPLFKH